MSSMQLVAVEEAEDDLLAEQRREHETRKSISLAAPVVVDADLDAAVLRAAASRRCRASP